MEVSWALQTNGLGKEFRDGEKSLWAVRDISIQIGKNTFTMIMGPSGSGKSTLLNLLGGLDKPTEGAVYVDGFSIDAASGNQKLSSYRRQKIGFVFQSFHLISNMTVLDNVAFPLHLAGVPRQNREKKAQILLEKVGLSDRVHYLINKLSGGEKQRVAIARALVNDPEIVLADEPTGQLDTRSGDLIVDLLMEACSGKITAVMVTHDERFAKYASRIIKIVDGKLAA